MTLLARIIDKEIGLDWTTPIGDALPPQMRHKIHPSHRYTTIERLSSHTSGLNPNIMGLENGALWPYIKTRGVTGNAGRLALAQSVLSRPPDLGVEVDITKAVAVYNEVNSALVALAIETATSMTWEEALQKEVFEPLELYHSGFGYANAERNSGDGDPVQPWPHNLNDNPNPTVGPDGITKKFVVYAGPDPGTALAGQPLALWPASGLHASTADVLSFCDMHMRGMRGKISSHGFLRKETWEMLQTSVNRKADATRCLWIGTNQWVTHGRERYVYGLGNGGASAVSIMPEMGSAFVCLANVAGDVGVELTEEGMRVCARKLKGEAE